MTRRRRLSPAEAVAAEVATVRRLRLDAHRHRLIAAGLARSGGGPKQRASGRRLAGVYDRWADDETDAADRLSLRVPARIWALDDRAAVALAKAGPLTRDEAMALVAMHGPGLTVAEATELVADLRTSTCSSPSLQETRL